MRIYTVTFASIEIFYVTNIDHHTCEDIVNNLYVDKAGKIILDNNYEEDFFLLTSIKMLSLMNVEVSRGVGGFY